MTTLERAIFALKLCSLLGCGLVAGVFFAFSTFVMRALAQLPPAQGMNAMQHINVTVINPFFMGVFMGTAATSFTLGIFACFKRGQPDTLWLLAGAFCYLIGTFGVTVASNVPLNDALAVAKAGTTAGAQLWATYLTTWTQWNHVRTLAAMGATLCFALSLWQRAR